MKNINKIIVFILVCTLFCCEKKQINYDLSDEVLLMFNINSDLDELMKNIPIDTNLRIILHTNLAASNHFMTGTGGLNIKGRYINPLSQLENPDTIIKQLRIYHIKALKELKKTDEEMYKMIEPRLLSFIVDLNSIYYLGTSNKNNLNLALSLQIINNAIYVDILERAKMKVQKEKLK